MFGLGKKKQQPVPAIIEARSMWGFSFHFVDTEKHGVAGRTSLCDTNVLPASSVREVTKDRIVESWDKQHEGWHWCPECVSILFGMDGFKGITVEKLKALL